VERVVERDDRASTRRFAGDLDGVLDGSAPEFANIVLAVRRIGARAFSRSASSM
jgi:hypothetical protein